MAYGRNNEQLSKAEHTRIVHKLLADYKATQDSRKRDKIVELNMNLVRKIGHGLARRSSDPVDDLIQIGSIGLIKAIEYFNPEAGAKFTTYATHLITGEIRHYLRDKTSMIRAPRELQELSFRINKIVQRLQSELGRDPTDLEIAEVLQEVRPGKIQEAYEVDRRRTLISLDQTISTNTSDNDTYLIDTLMDIKAHKLEGSKEDFLMLKDLIAKLKEPLRDIITMIYFQDIPQADVAQRLGISQMQVSRRLKKATAELQNLFSGSASTKASQPKTEEETKVPTNRPQRASRASLGARLKAKKSTDSNGTV